MSLDLGTLRIALDLDDDALTRGLAQARVEMAGLSSSAQTEVVKVKRTLGDGGTAGGRAFADGIGDGVKRSSTKLEGSGRDAGGTLSRGMQNSLMRNSPLIAAAVGGALIAGAPAAIAGAGVLFGGIAAVAVHSNAQVQAAATDMAGSVKASMVDAAQVTVPFFTRALSRLGDEAQTPTGSMSAAFTALQDPIDLTTTGVERFADNAMPGLVHAIQSSTPVFQGLASAMGSIGTGLGQFFDIIGQHSGAAGTALAQVGTIVGELLPILGNLMGEGAELASDVLPHVSGALHDVERVVSALGPALPPLLAAFLGFKAVTALAGPIDGLATKLGKFGTVGATAATGLGKLSSGLPLIGLALGVVGAAFEAQAQQVEKWGRALADGGSEAQQAKQQIQDLQNAAYVFGTGMPGFIGDITGYGTALHVAAQSGQKAKEAQQDYYASLSPLQQAQQDVTKATNDYSSAVAAYGSNSLQANSALQALNLAQSNFAGQQAVVSTALQGTNTAAQGNITALQAIANTASAADTQISLLKGALDALTGANVTADQAQIAVTQAVAAATQAATDHSAALSFVNGQLDLGNAKSAAASQVLITLAGTQKTQIATLEQQGASVDVVTAKSDAMRAQFIQVAKQMGANDQQAQALADRYLGIPTDVHTNIAANDAATAVIGRVQAALAALHDKAITVTTYNKMVSSGPAGIGLAQRAPQAVGHIVHAYAGGGFEPMRAGIAQIVPPNSLRIIGDRVRDDEAYIPINHSARSLAILEQTAQRMGVALGSAATPTGRMINDNRQVTIQTLDVQRAFQAMADQQRDLEFLAGVA